MSYREPYTGLDERDLDARRAIFDDPAHAAVRRTGGIRLGFLTFVGGEAQSIGDAHRSIIRLFHEAEQLGYSAGMLRTRHFQPYLSGPVSVLAAASQHTSTMHLGTAVISFHSQEPIRLLEELQTLDLVSGERLEIGIATGPVDRRIASGWERRYPDRASIDAGFEEFLRLLDGGALEAAPDRMLPGVASDEPVIVHPRSPGLRERIWLGAGSDASVDRAARLGLKLQLSNLVAEPRALDLPVEIAQYRQIERYLSAVAGGRRTPPETSISRTVLPLTGSRIDAKTRENIAEWESFLRPDAPGEPQHAFKLRSRVAHNAIGDPAHVVEFLRTDLALAAADVVLVHLPSNYLLDEQVAFLATVRDLVDEAIGVAFPATVSDRAAEHVS
ncbi:LLM class flavin-dependent oxidoreductase [Pseudoclavibacter chungangensis]|uniref:LLM class flavin-dependent oxidoreductase n=1 Tax=Pseudoclavibacter chungangensis TaxID=587635 RepID=A0A7J5BNC3_9MICO|nr:LLM class flavin-dependent oxidoreductase [Pseudoclavibacter chungangensis]KAB1653605.1 LLM class flavin-dependent oxidoreductase [Pseudoclavibacter chungangensis]NYJ68708.1 alkanesulfonate monooxygenase SsuD/methylene tetrahydromethanopterin reductase-like flavin-dependent oxidoreductase (luciferase family) [Pseudoclavibacter chungangensis]